MKRLYAFVLICIILCTCGCASDPGGYVQHEITPGIDVNEIRSVYVEIPDHLHRNVHEIIAEELNLMGIRATSGEAENAPQDIDAIVAYRHEWNWDLRMYMTRLRIFIEEPNTRDVLASGESLHGSMAGMEPKEMVREILESIFR